MTSIPAEAVDAAVGAAIRHERVRAGVKQEELATALGIDRTTLSRYEAGERGISISVLIQTAALLQIPLTQLLPADAARRVEQEIIPAPLRELVAALRQQPEITPQVLEFVTLVLEQQRAS